MNYKLRGTFSKDENCLIEILQQRGVEDVEAFLNPSKDNLISSYNLKNIEQGKDLLVKHLEKGSKICIIVDSDADGFTSASILWLYIKSIYPNARLSYMVHEEKQHGLEDKIETFEEKENFDLVILPDAGSYDVEYHQRLQEIGIDCLNIDHHAQAFDENGKPIVSEFSNTVVINNQLSPNYSNKSLCGAGMVYKFCKVLDEYYNVNYADNYLDLVALGEISDVMFQGTSETRYLITEGLNHINNLGFQSLIEAQSFSLKDKANYPYEGLTPIDVAFYISPLINAVTRVGTMAEKEIMFLAFIDPKRELASTKRGAKRGDIELACKQFARIAGNIRNRQNKEKDKAIEILEQRVYKEGLTENNIIVIEVQEEDNIRKTLTGLIAAYFVNKFNKPCLIGRMSDDRFLRGSMRSNGNFASLPDFKDYLEKTDMFEYVMGHAQASGFSIPEKQIENFINFSNSHLNEKDFQNCYNVDYIFNAEEDSLNTVGLQIGRAENCFGNGIDEVKVIIENIPLTNVLAMGAEKNSIKISYNEIDYVRFKDDVFAQEIQENRDNNLRVLARFNLNNWAGKTSVQCFIEDYEFVKNDSKFDF